MSQRTQSGLSVKTLLIAGAASAAAAFVIPILWRAGHGVRRRDDADHRRRRQRGA